MPPTSSNPSRWADEVAQSLLPATAASESAPAAPVEEAAAEAPAPAVAEAKLPLSNAVIARTIGRIGYACGEVASTSAVEGGAFKVTCTSGASYRAAPVRGRYHFRRLP